MLPRFIRAIISQYTTSFFMWYIWNYYNALCWLYLSNKTNKGFKNQTQKKQWNGSYQAIEKWVFKSTNLQFVDKSWRSNTQYSDYTQQNCIINIKPTKRLDLNCFHHGKEIIIWYDSHNLHYGGNNIVIYKYQINTLYTLNLHNILHLLHFNF